MGAEHLRALVDERAPGRSISELTRAAGVPENRLGYWLKPGTRLTRMPDMRQLREIAAIIGCETNEVYLALRRDIDGDVELSDGLSGSERELLSRYRALSRAEKAQLLRIAKVITLRD